MKRTPQSGGPEEQAGNRYALFAWIRSGKPNWDITAIAVLAGSTQLAEIVEITASSEHDALAAAVALAGQLAVAIRARGDQVADVKILDGPPSHIVTP